MKTCENELSGRPPSLPLSLPLTNVSREDGESSERFLVESRQLSRGRVEFESDGVEGVLFHDDVRNAVGGAYLRKRRLL